MKKAETFGERVRRLRGSLTQAEFAKKLGVRTASVNEWEGDKKRHLPSAETCFKLGNCAAADGQVLDAVWFWMKAGLSQQAILDVAGAIQEAQIRPPLREGGIDVPHLLGPSAGTPLRLPMELVNTSYAKYFVADEQAAKMVLAAGDTIILDTFIELGKGLQQFWDQLVLVEFGPASQARLAEYARFWREGRFLGNLRLQPDALLLDYSATLAPFDERRNTMLPQVGYWNSPVYSDVAAFERFEKDPEFREAQITEAEQRARKEIAPQAGVTILGRVIAWFAGQKESK